MYAEQLLPHDIEAEEAVLGSILIDSDAFLKVSTKIFPNDFYREKNRICYLACTKLVERNEEIDQITLSRELSRDQQLDIVGGIAYLSHLIAITPTSLNAEHYANLIARASKMRQLIDAASKISSIGYADSEDVDTSIRQAEDLIFKIRDTDANRGFAPLRQIFDEYLEDRATFADDLDAASGPIMTGYDDLDQLLGGLQRSDLVILGARPGLGKSSLAVSISVTAAKNGLKVGIFSLEMSREQLAMRMLAAEANVDAHRLRLGLVTESDEQRITDSIGQLSDIPLFIDDTPFQSVLEMQTKSRRLALEHGLDLLIVDYLQLIQGTSNSATSNRVQEMSYISRSIKGMARDLHIPILTLSQLSRVIETRPGHRPLLSDLRDSGSIEQDADIVMFIYREDSYYTEQEWDQQFPERPYPKGIAEVLVAKHRHGPTGSINLIFNENVVRFNSLPRIREI
jgi:replicative DNA helicase